MQQLESLGDKLDSENVIPVKLPSGRPRLDTKPAVTGSEAVVNTIGIVRCSYRRPDSDITRPRTDDSDLSADEVRCHCRLLIELAFRPAVFDSNVAALCEISLTQPTVKSLIRSVHCAADTPYSTPITGMTDC
jgi:hypothetical protein